MNYWENHNGTVCPSTSVGRATSSVSTVSTGGLGYTAGIRTRSRDFAPKRLVLPARDKVPAIVRWSFIAFVATLPFEAADLGFTSSSFSLAKLSGLTFFVCYFFYYNAVSGKRSCPPISTPLWCFLAYTAVYVVHGLFLNQAYIGQFISILVTLVQLMLLFWISCSLLQNETLARGALTTFAFAAVLSALGTLLHVPGFSMVIDSRIGARVTSLDFNPNVLAFSMALAAVILAGLALDIHVRKPWQRWILMGSILPLLAVIVRTGSRAGLASFAIGFLTYLLPRRQSQRRLSLVAMGILVAGALGYLVIQSPTALTRLHQSYSGNLSGRQVIIPASLGMVREQPFLGWQPVAYWEELARRVGQIWGAKDAHNLVFHLLLEVGLVGAVPFLVGLFLCARLAWAARSGSLGLLPLALILAALSANVTHTYLTRKPQWLVLALAVAAGTTAQKRSAVPSLHHAVNRSL